MKNVLSIFAAIALMFITLSAAQAAPCPANVEQLRTNAALMHDAQDNIAMADRMGVDVTHEEFAVAEASSLVAEGDVQRANHQLAMVIQRTGNMLPTWHD